MAGFVAETIGESGFGHYRIDIQPDCIALEPTDEPAEGYFLPGFVDIHIHGGFGIDFMSATPEQMASLDCRLGELGYDAYLPTTVTAQPAAILAALEALPYARSAAGFHLEGPFISPEFPGAQDPDRIAQIRPGDEQWEHDWGEILGDDRLRIVTLAPELANAHQLTSRLTKQGVVVSMGHSNATFDEARYGFELGATHITHTFNAMRGFHHREPGLAGYALLNPEIWTEVIYDRKHVSREAMALLLRVKPLDRVIAVSDGTKGTKLPAGGEVELWGRTAIVGEGEIRFEDGTLAGSTITLLDAFRNLTDDFGAETAIRACCLNPARAIGYQHRRYLLFDYGLNLDGVWSVEAL